LLDALQAIKIVRDKLLLTLPVTRSGAATVRKERNEAPHRLPR
jgi:hypothetical protein